MNHATMPIEEVERALRCPVCKRTDPRCGEHLDTIPSMDIVTCVGRAFSRPNAEREEDEGLARRLGRFLQGRA